MRRAGIIAALLVGMVVLSGLPAEAKGVIRHWGSSSRPVNVWRDGNLQGSSYGDWRVADRTSGTRSIGRGHIKDVRPGGDSIYYHMITQYNAGICYQPEYTSCSSPWYDYTTVNSIHTNSNLWVFDEVTTGVHANGDFARARFKSCVDRRLQPDPCTPNPGVITLGDTY